jgi:hypothetical protein
MGRDGGGRSGSSGRVLMRRVVWTEYLRYRAQLRGFELDTIEQIALFSEERYFDDATQRRVAIGRHGSQLVAIPYDEEDETVTPVTVHATTRQQINVRLQTGRFKP